MEPEFKAPPSDKLLPAEIAHVRHLLSRFFSEYDPAKLPAEPEGATIIDPVRAAPSAASFAALQQEVARLARMLAEATGGAVPVDGQTAETANQGG